MLVDAHRTIQHRYDVRFDGAALALYRDGRDMVAFHRDRDMRWLDDTVIALLVLGDRRPFLIRPRVEPLRPRGRRQGGDPPAAARATATCW